MPRLGTSLLIVVSLWASACGSTSSNTVAGPSPVKCAVSATNMTPSFPPVGGAGTITVAAERECSWSSTSQVAWVSLADPHDGRGDGTLKYNVAANPTGTPRAGMVLVGNRSVEVGQQAAACQFTVNRPSVEFSADGGTSVVSLQGPPGCPWSAASHASWVTFDGAAQGSGAAQLVIRAAANSGATRDTSVDVAGLHITVRQQAPGAPSDCAVTLSAGAASLPAGGGDGTVTLNTGAVCSWSISSDQPWLTVRSSAQGTGPADVTFRAAANPDSSSRVAHLTVGTAVFTVTQAGTGSPTCTFMVSPTDVSVAAAGGDTSVQVNASAATCGWTAQSQASWITVASGGTGTGSGTVSLSVAANPDQSPRTGTVKIAGATVSVQQTAAASSCTYTLEPPSTSVAAAGASGSVHVRTSGGCGWTSLSQDLWITVTAGLVGVGSGDVEFTVAANPTSAPRTGSIAIAGQTFTIQQSAAAPPETTVTGVVESLAGSCPSVTFSVGGTAVRTNGQTKFHGGGCGKLKNGSSVAVTGVQQTDGSIDANDVEIR
jgi:hypothetical protein